MTIEPVRAWLGLGGFTLLVALIAYGCAGANKLRHGDTIDVSSYPSDVQVAYKVFAVKCSRCHTLARPLNARIDDPQHWVRYVARMRLNPSSGINAKDAQVILRFLLYYMHQSKKDETEANALSEPTPAEPGVSAAPVLQADAAVEAQP
jgi:hypothetical protein